mgnify:CR=1 FL=1
MNGCGVLEIKKLLWRPKRFVKVDVTYEQAQAIARAHNRWWKPTHYDIVPPIVMQGLRSGRYADPNWSPPR